MAHNQSCTSSRYADALDDDDTAFSLKDWAVVKARIGPETFQSSRRFPSSKLIKSNISSTTSSPGYTIRGETDPSIYPFTSALKALQARSVYSSPQLGFTLNSKWNDAERYISNPLSGQVPLECLSSKTLSFRKIAVSETLTKPAASAPNQEKNRRGMSMTRDVGTQIAPMDQDLDQQQHQHRRSWSSLPTSIEEKSVKEVEVGDSCVTKVELEETGETQMQTKRKRQMMWKWRQVGGIGCLSLKSLWMRNTK